MSRLRTISRLAGASSAAILGVASFAMPAVAAPAPTATIVTMASQAGDYIGGGQQTAFVPSSSTVTASADPKHTQLTFVVSGAGGHTYTFTFAAPTGQALAPGLYTNAMRTPFRAATHPGIDIYGDGRGCNTDSGSFRVRDIAWGANGTLQRVSLTYEQHCEGGIPALFGEVRYKEPATGPVILAPSHLDFPAAYPHAATLATVTVVNRAAAPTKIVGAVISGTNKYDFAIAGSSCTQATLPIGGACAVYVRFQPTVAGSRSATVRFTTAAGAHPTVALTGTGIAGTTGFSYTSDPGDYIGAGQSGSFTPLNSQIAVTGTSSHVSARVDVPGAGPWMIDLTAPSGGLLLPGTYTGATRYPFNGTGAGLAIYSPGRGCNTLTGDFTINSAAYDPITGALQNIDVTMNQHCEGGTPALHARLQYLVR